MVVFRSLVVVAASLALGSASLPAVAIPRLDLTPYPAPAAAERRWVIQLPGVLPPSRDPALSPDPRQWRVQLIVGQVATVDCNQHAFSGRMRHWHLNDNVPMVFRVDAVGPLISTRMACPPDRPPRQTFVTMAGKPYVVPYEASRPIVIYAPAALQVRWRLWKAEREAREAQAL